VNLDNPPPVDNLEKFALRAWARALLWAEEELTLHQAVDALVPLAEELKIGTDTAQAIMVEFFARARGWK
jgi:hypothetical protein